MEKIQMEENNLHTLDVGKITGDEYMLAGNTMDDYLKVYPDLENTVYLNQLEFQNTYGRSHCTDYAAMHALIPVIGRELTPVERSEILKKREAEDKDFSRTAGGYTYKGMDNIRHWWNEKNPNDKIVQFAVNNRSQLAKDLLDKAMPFSMSYSGNRKYNIDSDDGVLEGYQFGTPTYGHAVGRNKLVIHDNYNSRYRLASKELFTKLVNNLVIHGYSYFFVKESWLTPRAVNVVKAMKAKIYNGQNPADKATEREICLMINRALAIHNPSINENEEHFRGVIEYILREKISNDKTKSLYNGQRPFDLATQFEMAIMFTRAVTGNDKLSELVLTREQVAEIIGEKLL